MSAIRTTKSTIDQVCRWSAIASFRLASCSLRRRHQSLPTTSDLFCWSSCRSVGCEKSGAISGLGLRVQAAQRSRVSTKERRR
jgi:hypothetical protein